MYTLEIQNGSDSSGCFCLRVATSTRITTLCNAQRRLLHNRESSFTTHGIFYTVMAEKVTLHFTINMKQIALGESAKIKSHELRQPFWKSHLQIEAETYHSAGTRSLGLLEMQIRTKEEAAVYETDTFMLWQTLFYHSHKASIISYELSYFIVLDMILLLKCLPK